MEKEQIDTFEKTQAQLEALHNEVSALSKKAQNDAVNKFKLKFVNQILEEANKILGDKYKPFSYFELFDENDIPTTSDVALVISQYLGCMERLRVNNIHEDISYVGGKVRKIYWYWIGTTKETYPPSKIK